MKIRYKGPYQFDSLTDGKVYTCLDVKGPFLRIIDDSGEDYVYTIIGPRLLDSKEPPGHWELVEDDEKGTLKEVFERMKKWTTSN